MRMYHGSEMMAEHKADTTWTIYKRASKTDDSWVAVEDKHLTCEQHDRMVKGAAAQAAEAAKPGIQMGRIG